MADRKIYLLDDNRGERGLCFHHQEPDDPWVGNFHYARDNVNVFRQITSREEAIAFCKAILKELGE